MPDKRNIKINVTSVSDKVSAVQFSSLAQSYPTLSDPMTATARPPCPSQIPGVYTNSCPLSQ